MEISFEDKTRVLLAASENIVEKFYENVGFVAFSKYRSISFYIFFLEFLKNEA